MAAVSALLIGDVFQHIVEPASIDVRHGSAEQVLGMLRTMYAVEDWVTTRDNDAYNRVRAMTHIADRICN